MPSYITPLLAPVIVPLIKIALVLGGLMTAAAYLVLLERWIAAWVQDRLGPNRVGIPLTKIRLFGLGQPLADGLKFIFKEEYTPAHVDKVLFIAAPISILIAALSTFAVIPFGSVLPPLGIEGLTDPIPLIVAPGFDVGAIYVFALGSIAVYGVILGGWASNNKYSFLGGLRSSAQLIAYEILGWACWGWYWPAARCDWKRSLRIRRKAAFGTHSRSRWGWWCS
jgi:NADH-quinone oxidoreductase subunit H